MVLDIAADLPMVSVDAVLLEQVLFNLLDNAAKYAPAEISTSSPHRPAGMRCRIWAERSGSSWSALVLSVAMYPGATALTLTRDAAHSLAKAFVSWAMPPLLAA